MFAIAHSIGNPADFRIHVVMFSGEGVECEVYPTFLRSPSWLMKSIGNACHGVF
jgi:hypothetical protein